MQTRNGMRPVRTPRKRIGSLLLLVLALLICAPGSSATEAVGPDTLLETLLEKGVLTEEEYRKLKQQDKQQDSKIDKVLNILGGLNIGTVSYFQFAAGESWNQDEGRNEAFHQFRLTRGYLDVRMKLASWLSFRITPDIRQVEAGDIIFRLKYLYAEFAPPDLAFFTDVRAQAGVGHVPWFDFEEKINPYRSQGTMFIERAGMFNAADLGVSVRGNFGGQLGAQYQQEVNRHYPGRWGSWHVGVYNGGGYDALDINQNVVPEVRVSLRPLPGIVPGLQVHYFGLFGQGNTAHEPVPGVKDFPLFQVNLCMVSYQDRWITLTGQYAWTHGNSRGTLVVPDTSLALRGQGFSLFFNTKLPLLDKKLNLFARWDRFDPDRDDRATLGEGNDSYDLVIGGVAWEFFKQWHLLAAYERTLYQENSGGVARVPDPGLNLPDAWMAQLVLQMAF